MKKSIVLVAVLAAFSFASCKKDRVCTCVDSTGTSSVVTYTKSKKRDARSQCLSSTATYNNVTYTTTCTLK
jgi:hypothetical protein